MQKARHKRKSYLIILIKNLYMNKQKYSKNIKTLFQYQQEKELRKTQKSKISILKTYVELKIQERKNLLKGICPH